MEKKHGTLICGLIVTAAAAVISLLSAPNIPEGAQVAVHFDAHGTANGWMSREMALVFGPLLTLGITICFALTRTVRFTDDEDHAGSRRALDTAMTAALGIAAGIHALILLHAQGKVTNVASAALPLAGGVFLVIGNLLGKTQRNFLVGIRTPWTLASAYAWQKSNRLAGHMMVALGLGVMLASMLLPARETMFLLLGGSIVLFAVCVVLSWHYWRTDSARNHPG